MTTEPGWFVDGRGGNWRTQLLRCRPPPSTHVAHACAAAATGTALVRCGCVTPLWPGPGPKSGCVAPLIDFCIPYTGVL